MAGSSLDGCSLICAKHSTVAHTGERISAPRQQTTAGVPLAISSLLAAGWVASLALEGAPSASTKRPAHENVASVPTADLFFRRLRHAGLPMPRREATNPSWPSRLGLDLRQARRRHWRPAFFRRLPIGTAPRLRTRPGGAWPRTGPPTVPGAARSGDHFVLAADAKGWLPAVLRRRGRPAGPLKKIAVACPTPPPPTSSPRALIGVAAPSDARARPPSIGGFAPSRPVGA